MRQNATKKGGKMSNDNQTIFNILCSLQDYGILEDHGEFITVDNSKIAKVLCESGCVIVKTIPERKHRYKAERGKSDK